MSSIFWFRRDLRLGDNPALNAAVRAGDGDVVPVWIVDTTFSSPAGPNRVKFLRSTLQSLDASLNKKLTIRCGDPAKELLELAKEVGATEVFATGDYAPKGRSRDEIVGASLARAGVTLHFIDSPYSVIPGTVRTQTGTPCRVFTAFRRGWELQPLETPLDAPTGVSWAQGTSVSLDELVNHSATRRPHYFGDLGLIEAKSIPEAGEKIAHQLLEDFLPSVDAYNEARNIPSIAGVSRLSPHLRFGTIHPRQILSAVDGMSTGAVQYRSEICWREFYADVLFHNPQAVSSNLISTMDQLRIDRNDKAVERFQMWAKGETGYPMVDAAMRQLLEDGWMHNRVRMLVASFLVKHLHLDWRWGAKWFMWHLIDGDIASNQNGWQWTAGTGTDAAPFYRVFNPSLQAERFDPQGLFIHKYVNELRDIPAPQCLQPGGGEGLLAAPGYFSPMVDAATERDEALARYAEAKELAKATK